MLNYQPNIRANIRDIIGHPWSVNLDLPTDEQVIVEFIQKENELIRGTRFRLALDSRIRACRTFRTVDRLCSKIKSMSSEKMKLRTTVILIVI